jgi:hypothetical protein
MNDGCCLTLTEARPSLKWQANALTLSAVRPYCDAAQGPAAKLSRCQHHAFGLLSV